MSTSNLREAAKNSGVAPAKKTFADVLQGDKVKNGLRAVATKYLSPDRMLKLAVNAVARTPELQRCDPQTVLGAIMASTALGLEPNTPEGQAYLIPYKRRAKQGNNWVDVWDCQFQIGYRGFITLAYRIPGMKKFQSEAIHEGDQFKYQLGSDTFLQYSKGLRDRGLLIGSFCYTEIGGGEAATVLPLDEIMKIRGRSETHKALTAKADEAQRVYEREQNAKNLKDRDYALRKLDDTPWEMWEDDMAAKSAIKKHCKKLPKALGQEGSALGVAAELDGDSARLIDIGAMADADFANAVQNGEEQIPDASTDGSEALSHDPDERLSVDLKTRQSEHANRGAANEADDFGSAHLE